MLHVELAPSFAGYSARLMRSIVIGAVDATRAGLAERLAALQDRQFAAMRPGARAADVDRVLREGVLAAGLRDSYANITGYTLGYYSRQPIRSSDFTRTFHPKADWRLEAGMVFHMYSLGRRAVLQRDRPRRPAWRRAPDAAAADGLFDAKDARDATDLTGSTPAAPLGAGVWPCDEGGIDSAGEGRKSNGSMSLGRLDAPRMRVVRPVLGSNRRHSAGEY